MTNNTRVVELPEIPAEIAEAIEYLRTQDGSSMFVAKNIHFMCPETREWISDNRNQETFFVALSIGYNVERTEECGYDTQ
ncbi:DUF1642 domain-containing protein [Salibacterium salarium]|uniref:DUF1642 domain-containing protein n=1 Tax=Salibacterium salarium TaxID=284579 RepID=A0A428MRY6_9BACI|nr:DUF1642 domain-containing protein [Salibacterium salarium]RSL28892.1 DUF1642 domain-containing protein [Salibacterium salarium]